MATIYRFIVEQKVSGGSGSGRKATSNISNKKTTAKKGRAVSLLGGSKGGVEHNRKMRAINPLINKMTFGYHEKGMRLGRAALGLIKVNPETGAFAGLSGTAVAIIVSLAIQTTLKIQGIQRERAEKTNTQNFKAMENGFSSIHGEYKVSKNFWDGAITYNENK